MKASREGRKGREEGKKFATDCRLQILSTVRDSLDAVFQMSFTEINQETKLTVAQPKLRQHLFAVNTSELFDGLQFHDDPVFHNEIGPKTFIEDEFVANWDWNLTINSQSELPKFVSKHDLVNGLEQSWTGSSVNLEGGIENQSGKLIVVQCGCGLHEPENGRMLHHPQVLASKCSLPSRPSRPSREKI